MSGRSWLSAGLAAAWLVWVVGLVGLAGGWWLAVGVFGVVALSVAVVLALIWENSE